MKKLRVIDEGKQFEVFVKFLVTQQVYGAEQIVGAAYAGSMTSCRAVHAALYKTNEVELYDSETEQVIQKLRTSCSFKRIETVDGKVMHHFLAPRSSVDEEYQFSLNEMVKNNKDSDSFPERVLLAPQGNIKQIVGLFLADTYGLPRTHEWVMQYADIFSDNIDTLRVIQNEVLSTEWLNLKAVRVKEMKESKVLALLSQEIQNGRLNPRSTSLMGEGAFRENMSTEEYLMENASILAEKLDAYVKPLTNGSNLSPFLGELKRIPVPAQARASMAALEVLKHKKGIFLVGDMGTGKTQMTLSTIYTYARQREVSGAKDGLRVLIVAPANVVPKWATSEIPKVIKRHCFTTRILKTTNHALKYVREVKSGKTVPKGKIEFVLVSTDRMKLTAQGFVLGAKWNPISQEWISPNTGKALHRPKQMKAESEEETVAGWKDVVSIPIYPPSIDEIKECRKRGTLMPNGLPKGFVKTWKSDIRAFQDDYKSEQSHCSLARPARKEWGESRGNPRWMIAEILHRHLPNHFHFGVFDECHQMKASDSGRGAALAKILKACRKSILLTGTLTNGASTSIQSLLWRVFPGELLETGINYETSKEQWAHRFGVVEKIVTKHDKDMTVGRNSNRKQETVVVKEKPGISPKLITSFLLDKCIFVELSELRLPLVEIAEIPVVVELEDDHFAEYDRFHAEHYATAQSLQRKIGSGAWAKFNPSTINYADQPHLAPNIEFFDKDGTLEGSVSAPAFPEDYITAKEQALVDTIQGELAKNRRMIVFTHYTGEYGMNQRLKKVMDHFDIKSEIMDEKIPTEQRFEWLEQQAETDVEVLIMNQRLVEVGLDLLSFPSIMFYQLNDDINVVRQASRRAWRLGQNKQCKVFYFVADKTMQMAQFQRLMSRRVAAMIVEGRIERSSDLAKYADTSSNSLTADLSKSLESTELANAWKQAAALDVNKNLDMVSEGEFEKRLTQAFKDLTEETIQICGYVPVDEDLVEIDFDALDEAFEEWDALEAALKAFDEVTQQESQSIEIDPIKQKVKRIKSHFEVEPVHKNVEQLDLFGDLFAG